MRCVNDAESCSSSVALGESRRLVSGEGGSVFLSERESDAGREVPWVKIVVNPILKVVYLLLRDDGSAAPRASCGQLDSSLAN